MGSEFATLRRNKKSSWKKFIRSISKERTEMLYDEEKKICLIPILNSSRKGLSRT